MARKDVELIFRAKDQATKVVGQINDAISDFNQASSSLGKSAAGNAGALARLAASLSELDKSFKGATAAQQLASKMERAKEGFEATAKSVAKTTEELADYERRSADAARQTEELKTKAQQAAAAQEAQAKRAKEAAAAEQTTARSLREANAERSKAATSIPRLTNQIEAQTGRVEEAQGRFDRLKSEIESVEKPTATLQKRFASAATTLENAQGRLASLRNSLEASTNGFDNAGTKVERLSSELAQMSAAAIATKDGLARAKENAANLAVAAAQSARSERQLSASVEETSASLVKHQADLQRAEQGMTEMAAAQARGEQAAASLARAVRANLLPEYAKVKTAMAEAATEQKKQEAILKGLAGEMNRVKVPTEAMVVGFNNARVAAQSNKQAISEYQIALQSIRNALRSAASGQISYSEATSRIAAASGRLRDTLKSIDGTKAANSLKEVGRASTATGSGMRQAATDSQKLEQALKKVEGSGRQSLSLFQRLRGEVLSFAASYIGLYAAVEAVKRVVDVTATLEQAQRRLNVVFEGNGQAVSAEMDFLRRNAERLGISFGDLSDEYTKFAVATKGTNLEGQNTRKIFLAVAEAARVNGTSMEDTKGVFTALTQIVSKGSVQMEELRQQLGDRLPGALQLMADGLGVSTKQLIKMMEQGQVSSEALVGFADKLNEKFGPQLAASLRGITAETGRFQDALFNAFKVVAEGGFVDAITRLLRQLNEQFRSAEAISFFQKLSPGLALLTDALGVVIRNFDLLVLAASAFAGVKIAGAVSGLVGSLSGLSENLFRARSALGATATAMTKAGGAGAAAAVGVRGLGTALKLLTSTTGIGLLITVATTLAGAWVTSVDSATETMVGHQAAIDQVKNAYEQAAGSSDKFAESLKKVSRLQIEQDLRKAKDALNDLSGPKMLPAFDISNANLRNFREQYNDLTKAFNSGKISAQQYEQALNLLDPSITKIVRIQDNLLEAVGDAKAFESATGRVTDLENALKLLANPTLALAEQLFPSLKQSAETAGDSIENKLKSKAEAFRGEMDKLDKMLPKLSDELERMGKIDAINKLYKDAANLATTMSQVMTLTTQANSAIDGVLANSGSYGNLTDRIIGIESGGKANAKNPNSSATGLGQFVTDTWLRMFKQYFPDRADAYVQAYKQMGKSDAAARAAADKEILDLRNDPSISKNMVSLYIKENAAILQKAGVAVTDANLYLAHFLGPGGAVAVGKASADRRVADLLSPKQVAANQSILGGGQTVGGLQQWAQRKVGAVGGGGETSSEVANIEKEITQQQERQVEKANEYNEALNTRLELSADQALNDGKLSREGFIQKQLTDEQNKARAAGVQLSEVQIAKIKEQAGALYDSKHANDENKEAAKGVAEAEKQVNDLYSARNTLIAAMKAAEKSGDSASYLSAKEQLTGVNTELEKAIQNAIAMWQAIGGPQADAAIAKLEAMQVKSSVVSNKFTLDWKQVGTMFADGLTNAFGNFAQAVAGGAKASDAAKDAFLQFAADFLQQIGKMIIQAMILKALNAAFPGLGIGGAVGGAISAHTGGVIGRGGLRRRSGFDPAVFNTAVRYHSGGVAGLRPNEVPAVLEKGEEVLTPQDPRHRDNAGAPGGEPVVQDIKIVNMIDSGDMLTSGLATRNGEKAILNFISDNAGAVRRAINS